MGSAAVLLFVGARFFLPDVLCGLLAVSALEYFNGWIPLRGVAEMAQGRHSFPGHGFETGFKPDARGAVTVAMVLATKVIALAALPPIWQPRAVLVLPVLGRSAQTLALILSPQRLPDTHAGDPRIHRRRIRALFLSATLLLLLFLFPWRAAISALLLFGVVAVLGLRACNAWLHGLTLQTVSLLSEGAETSVLLLLVWMARHF